MDLNLGVFNYFEELRVRYEHLSCLLNKLGVTHKQLEHSVLYLLSLVRLLYRLRASWIKVLIVEVTQGLSCALPLTLVHIFKRCLLLRLTDRLLLGHHYTHLTQNKRCLHFFLRFVFFCDSMGVHNDCTEWIFSKSPVSWLSDEST